MNQGFGSESPRAHAQKTHRPPARTLVVIESAGTTVARLFDAARVQVAEFDAGTEEAAQMMAGLVAERGAEASDWDRALEGHSLEERRAAEIYRLAV